MMEWRGQASEPRLCLRGRILSLERTRIGDIDSYVNDECLGGVELGNAWARDDSSALFRLWDTAGADGIKVWSPFVLGTQSCQMFSLLSHTIA